MVLRQRMFADLTLRVGGRRNCPLAAIYLRPLTAS